MSSEELMHKILFNLSFSETEAAVYVYLTKEGPQTATDVGKALNLNKQMLNWSLRKMQSKGTISAYGYPARFSAIPFEKVLDLIIKHNIEEAERMVQNKEELLFSWQSMADDNSEN